MGDAAKEVKRLAKDYQEALELKAVSDKAMTELEEELREQREGDERYKTAVANTLMADTIELQLREAIVAHYNETGEKKVAKVDGVSVAVSKKYSFEEKLAMEWAIQNMPMAVRVTSTPSIQTHNMVMRSLDRDLAGQLWAHTQVTLDEKALVKVFKGNSAEDIPPFLTIEEVPGARISKEVVVDEYEEDDLPF